MRQSFWEAIRWGSQTHLCPSPMFPILSSAGHEKSGSQFFWYQCVLGSGLALRGLAMRGCSCFRAREICFCIFHSSSGQSWKNPRLSLAAIDVEVVWHAVCKKDDVCKEDAFWEGGLQTRGNIKVRSKAAPKTTPYLLEKVGEDMLSCYFILHSQSCACVHLSLLLGLRQREHPTEQMSMSNSNVPWNKSLWVDVSMLAKKFSIWAELT